MQSYHEGKCHSYISIIIHQDSIDNFIDNSLVIPVGVAKCALILHADFLHHAAGCGIVFIMTGRNSPKASLSEQIINSSGRCLRHDAIPPPFFAQTLADFSFTNIFPDGYYCQTADHFAQFF